MKKLNALVKWIDDRLPIVGFLTHFRNYQTPKNLTYLWTFGSLAGIVLVLMILSGIFLAMNYVPTPELAFQSVERIMRDVNYGWLIRYIHMNGASAFFIVVYIHMFRGLYYGSYKKPRELLWILGVVLFLLMMATAFLGYVLPWGQMSFWGATVITNLFSVFGDGVVEWLLGAPTVSAPTLNRFFALHYLLPFMIIGVVFLHLIALHKNKSNNPTGVDLTSPNDVIPFHPYYTIKDLVGFGVFLLCFLGIVCFSPNLFSEPDNYVPANPMVTPSEIVPEWYFLPFYAMLRSVPDKLFGVLAMFGSIGVLFIVPWLDTSPVRSAHYRPIYRLMFWVLVINCLILGWIGGKPPEGHYLLIGRLATAYYFFHFLILLPILGRIETPRFLPVESFNVK